MKRGLQRRMSGCKGKDGRMTGEEGKILERWIEYFTVMLNEEKRTKRIKRTKSNLIVRLDQALEQPQEICKEPKRQEIGYATQRMKNNRAPWGRYNRSGINKIWRGRSNGCSPRIN